MRLAVPRSLILSTLIAALPAFGSSPAPRCKLGDDDRRIDHVVYIQFDNTHLRRDRAAVPSDPAEIRAALDAEAFHGQSINDQQARRWIDRADDLIVEAGELTR